MGFVFNFFIFFYPSRNIKSVLRTTKKAKTRVTIKEGRRRKKCFI